MATITFACIKSSSVWFVYIALMLWVSLCQLKSMQDQQFGKQSKCLNASERVNFLEYIHLIHVFELCLCY